MPILFSYIYRGRSIIFVGGYDAVWIPEIKYGSMHGWRGTLNKIAYKIAHKVVISSGEELGERLTKHVNVDYDVIHCGIDTDYWKPSKTKRTIDYITVGAINAWERKGMDKFMNMARKLPGKSFVAVNCGTDINVPPNVVMYPKIPKHSLKNLYNQSKYYLQLSVYESFGISLAEAMSMGCLPIVTNVGIMPKIAGGVTTRKGAREHIIKNYNINIRKDKIKKLCGV